MTLHRRLGRVLRRGVWLVASFCLLAFFQSVPQASTVLNITSSSVVNIAPTVNDKSSLSAEGQPVAARASKSDAAASGDDSDPQGADGAQAQDSGDDDNGAGASGDLGDQPGADSQNDDGKSQDDNVKSQDDAANGEQNDPAPDAPPTLEQNLNLYQDSEHYVTLTSTSVLTAAVHQFDISLRKDSIIADDLQGSQNAESNVISIHRDLSEQFGLGGGLGSSTSLRSSDVVGSFSAHANVASLSVDANVTHDRMLNNAEEIRSNVRQTDFNMVSSADFSSRLSSSGEFHHKEFSDGNHDNELTFGPQYGFHVESGKLAFGYGLTYMAFARGTTDGYWAPQYLLQHDLSATWSFDWVDTYGIFTISAGHQSVRANGEDTQGPSSSGYEYSTTAAIGTRPIPGTIIEYYWNLNSSPKWNSTSIGLKLTYGD
jgi:hypothetical protein